MTSKVTQEAMTALHAELAKQLAILLKGTTDPDTGAHIPVSAAVMSVARQFLKDSGIDAVPKVGTPMGDLAGLPEFNQDGDNVVPMRFAEQR